MNRGRPASQPRPAGGSGTTAAAISNQRRTFLYYLTTLAVLGAGVIYLATSRMGPGISTDSAMILSTGENLVKGRGLVDYRGAPLTQFPPLYSIILGAGSLIFRQDVFVVGWYLNLLVFAALIWFSGLYLYDAFQDEPFLAYFGGFIILSSTSLIQISANIASDPLFMLIVIFFLMSATGYLRSREPKYAVLAAVLTIMGCFQRYAGLSMVIAGSLMAAYDNWDRPWKAIGAALLFGVITGAPIFAWGYLHNAPINGTVFGARLPSVASGNFVAGAQKVLYWFIPYRIISSVGVYPLLLLIVAACAGVILVAGTRRFLQEIRRPEIVPNVVFLLVYFSVLVFDISYYELKGLKTDRVHIIGLTSLLIILFAFGNHLLHAAKRRLGRTAAYGTSLVALLIWSAYPIIKSNEYVRESMAHGDVSSYNSINKGNIRNSALARYLSSLDIKDKSIYSNGTDTAWFLLHTQIKASPTLESADRGSELQLRYQGWPGPSGSGYIVWIHAEAYKTNYATPDELSSIADITKLYSDETASVYFVQPH
jgi:hypothetical protein